MIVVDASVVVRILANEPGAEAALARLGAEPDRAAPDWVRVEVANALLNKVFLSGLPKGSVATLLRAVPSYAGTLHDTVPLLGAAMTLALRLERAVYDCLYLALAERERGVLVTADKQFASRATKAGLSGMIELLA